MNSAYIRRVIAAGMIGNALERYDFAIYGYFAVQIGRHFFPHDDAVAVPRPVRDLLLFAKHLFVTAMAAIVLAANSEAALRARRGLAVLQGDWLHRTNLWRQRRRRFLGGVYQRVAQ
jgi:hypothetical protein